MRRTAAFLLILLAGCSTSSKASAPATTPTMTTRQVASIVAEHRSQVLDAIGQESNCTQAALLAGSDSAFKGVLQDPGPDRAIDPLTACEGALNGGLSTDAGAIATGLSGIRAPAELQSLVAQTRSSARAVSTAAKTTSACLPDFTAMDGPDLHARYAADDAAFNCLIGVDDFTASTKALQSALGGWDAYL